MQEKIIFFSSRVLFGAFVLSNLYLHNKKLAKAQSISEQKKLNQERYVILHMWFNAHNNGLAGAFYERMKELREKSVVAKSHEPFAHVALSTHKPGAKPNYISFWPNIPNGETVGKSYVKGKFVSFFEDVSADSQHSMPDVQIKLYSLNIEKIDNLFEELKKLSEKGNLMWKTEPGVLNSESKSINNTYNCATMTARFLVEGDIKNLVEKITDSNVFGGAHAPEMRRLLQNDRNTILNGFFDRYEWRLKYPTPKLILHICSRVKEIEIENFPYTKKWDEIFKSSSNYSECNETLMRSKL